MTNAKQKFVDYREGSFIDFEGKDHYFVVCAVLKESTILENLTRVLSFGVSFCNPIDKNNNELGKKIAYGKSINVKNTNVLMGRAGLLNIDTVKYILDNEVNHVKQYPEQYSVAYAKAKEKYEKSKALAQKTALYNKVVAD
ncbi:hypothetical protein [Catenibacterium sp.]|uniref:hypothetical protein n=1 Tax=Catenibacterium sp. TaxID=2049022 RepID=UPI002E76A1D6|nr:hypothetical protein [Catenibacterium sp.]MEE0041516.1 hypothetical protein [Catenibacterium sp.]